jgi:hypothetical protein
MIVNGYFLSILQQRVNKHTDKNYERIILMNNYLFDEIAIRDEQRQRIAESVRNARAAQEQKPPLRVQYYQHLAKLGEWMQDTGNQMNEKFGALAKDEKESK